MKNNSNRNLMTQPDESDLDALYAEWTDDRNSAQPLLLKTWVERFPSYRTELAQWTSDAPIMERANALPADLALEARTLELGKERLAILTARFATATARPLTSLLSQAKQLGLNAKSLASALGIGVPVVAKLEQRLIRPASLPARLIEQLATTLRVGVDEVRTYLTQPPSLAPFALYKSDGTPQAGAQEDFIQAIRSCPDMSDAQKQMWIL